MTMMMMIFRQKRTHLFRWLRCIWNANNDDDGYKDVDDDSGGGGDDDIGDDDGDFPSKAQAFVRMIEMYLKW